jgi:hypothetical protein
MNLVPTITETTLSLLLIDSTTEDVARLAHATSQRLNDAYYEFWKGEDAEIEARMNTLGPDKVTEVFTSHHAIATALNDFLTLRNSPAFPAIAITTAAREFIHDNAGFHLMPLPAPTE